MNRVDLKFYKTKRDMLELRYGNRLFTKKTAVKNSQCYWCAHAKCNATVSLEVDRQTGQLKEPFVITNKNESHIETCKPHDNDFFVIKEFVSSVKTQIDSNPGTSTQQLYKMKRNLSRSNSDVSLPDYTDVKSLQRIRAKCQQ